jgi:hypothetical protein
MAKHLLVAARRTPHCLSFLFPTKRACFAALGNQGRRSCFWAFVPAKSLKQGTSVVCKVFVVSAVRFAFVLRTVR